MNLCVFVVFDLRWMIGNQINSFAASLLCEKKETKVSRFVQSYVPDWLRQVARALGTLYLVLCT